MHKITKSDHPISNLIFKRTAGEELSLEETKQLNDWIQESESNQSIFESLRQSAGLHSYSERFNQIDKQAAWKSINKQIVSNKIRFFNPRFFRYAAMLALCLLMAGGFFIYNFQHKTQPDPCAGIIPGSNKAILYTSAGSVIDLENNDSILSHSGLQITNAEKTLSYQTNDHSSVKNQEVQYDRLVTPKGGEYELILSDGTHVWINADSELKYPTRFTGNERVVFLEGEAYFQVKTDAKHPFIVKTKNMDIRATGTAFNVMAYRDENASQATLVQGKVSVDVKLAGKEAEKFVLHPGMQVEYQDGSASGTAYMVDINRYIGWKNGLFVFKGERLENILRTTSRWYDVEFIYEDKESKEILFTGEIKKFDSFRKLLEVFQAGSNVEFTIKERRIIVANKKKN